jgi:hypothetical protein
MVLMGRIRRVLGGCANKTSFHTFKLVHFSSVQMALMRRSRRAWWLAAAPTGLIFANLN